MRLRHSIKDCKPLKKTTDGIKPKFKIGQTVWIIDGIQIYHVMVYQINCLMNPEKLTITYYFGSGKFMPATEAEVFATCEEAEKALANRRGAK